MPIFSLLIPFVFLFLIFQKKYSCWRSSVLSAAIIWGLLLVVVTEALSLFILLTFEWLLTVLATISIILCFVYLHVRKKAGRAAQPEITRTPFSSLSISLLLGIGFIIAVVGLIALLAAPNNGDSMTYHLARIVHWIQNHSVAHYPTSILRQVYLNPGAEFAVLHLQILSGGDRWDNLVQWFGMSGSIMGVTLIAKQLGANNRGEIFTAVVCATIPMGILQASSTQNDWVVSFWLVCFVYYLRLWKMQPNWTYSLAVGISLGLALLTKATAYLYAIPFLIWFGFSGWKIMRWKLWKPAFIILAVALIINLGYYARNFDMFGSPFGITRGASSVYALANESFTLPAFISNIIRNIGLHICTPFRSINAITERGILLLHTFLGVDANDQRTTWMGKEFHVELLSSHESNAGNPFHLFLILWSIAALGMYRQRRSNRGGGNLAGYTFAVTTAFLVFSLYLKWQPFHSRLHLPLFVLWSPVIAIALSQTLCHKLANAIAIVLIVFAFPWVLYNANRPLIGQRNIFTTSRIDQYFSNTPDLKDAYINAAHFLKSKTCSEIGLALGWDDPEYSLWILLQNSSNNVIRIEHVNVKNTTAIKRDTYTFAKFSPCAVIALNAGQSGELFIEEGSYVHEFSSCPVGVFMKR